MDNAPRHKDRKRRQRAVEKFKSVAVVAHADGRDEELLVWSDATVKQAVDKTEQALKQDEPAGREVYIVGVLVSDSPIEQRSAYG